jgi:hypothetical protein
VSYSGHRASTPLELAVDHSEQRSDVRHYGVEVLVRHGLVTCFAWSNGLITGRAN